MSSRVLVYLACGAVALAWLVGYSMGGGYRIGSARFSGPRHPPDREGDAASTNRSPEGIARPATDTLADIIAKRHVPWTRERLLSSAEQISREPDIAHLVRLLLKLTEQFELTDFPMAVEAGQEMDESIGEGKDIYRVFSLMRWAELDPRAAADYLKSKGELKGGIMAQRGVLLGVWAGSDPAAAIGWAKSIEDKDDRRNAIKEVLSAIARRSPGDAIAFANAHAPELVSDGTVASAINEALRRRSPEQNARLLASLGGSREISQATREWAAKDPRAALEWAEGLPDPAMRATATGSALAQFAGKEPSEAAARMASRAATDPPIADAAAVVAGKLAARDPEAAARWAETLPVEMDRHGAYRGIGASYAEKDPASGARWLSSLPQGPVRDQAAQSFADVVTRKDPVTAVEWAASISDPKSRTRTVRGVVMEWFRTNPAAAFEWLNTNRLLSEEERKAVLAK